MLPEVGEGKTPLYCVAIKVPGYIVSGIPRGSGERIFLLPKSHSPCDDLLENFGLQWELLHN